MPKNAQMKMSRKGIDWLIQSEGVRYQVYDDRGGGIIPSYESANGYPTIGVGHLIRSGSDKQRFEKYLGGREEMTHDQVIDLLREDLPKYEKPAQEKTTEPITQEMFDAIVHHTFNVGGGAKSVKNTIKLRFFRTEATDTPATTGKNSYSCSEESNACGKTTRHKPIGFLIPSFYQS